MVDILTDQNEYWKRESEKWKIEAEELKSFLVDVENETELKSMLGNMERRFLQALGEQTDSFQEKMLTERQIKRIQKEYGSRKREWAAEKRRLVNIVMNLQISIQRMRRSGMNGITTDQLVMLKEKMDDLGEKEVKIAERMATTEKERQQITIQLVNVESLRNSMETIVENRGDLIKIQRILQADQFNTKRMTVEVKQLKAQLIQVQKDVTLKEAQIEDLTKQNNELILASMNVELYTSKDRREFERVAKTVEMTAEGHSALELPIWRDESEPDDLTARSSVIESDRSRIPKTRTIFYDNSRDFEKQVRQIKETARLCIQNYKEQVAQKDEQLEKYRKLLEDYKTQVQELQDTPTVVTKIVEPPRLLKKSSEIVNNHELEDKEREILSLRNEILDLEAANARLGDSMRSLMSKQKIKKFSTGMQTEVDESEPIKIDIRSPPPAPKSDSGSTYNVKRVDTTWKSDERDVVAAQLRIEIKRLKTRNSHLVKANKELSEACETIKKETYAKIESRYGTSPTEADLERVESQLEMTRKELKSRDLTIRSLKSEIVQLQQHSKIFEGKNQKDQVERWNERKRREEQIDSLKRRVRDLEESLQSTQQLLERRDRRIDQLTKDSTIISTKTEEIRTMKADLRRQKEEITLKEVKYVAEIDSYWQRFTSLADQMSALQKENSKLKHKKVIIRMQEDFSCQVELTSTRKASPVGSPKTIIELPKLWNQSEETSSRVNEDIHTISRKLRITELRLSEMTERFDSLKIQYSQLEINYNTILRLERERKSDGSAALAVLKDKLVAKDKQVEQQRQKIDEMERKSWAAKML
ncbi:hypothetical protein L596_009519 [Steinernema carpocapsae]|uniref:Uncharacterized protein n=1 Tax=Steinernema carpocapsae TaxID=34508 RepID=A0A4V6A6R8_STECR|nr:hypothetical protein L596_009519 [Steinernema carpocapsae]